ncbi:MAG TPA: hypothetical protein VGI40_11130 [Pirellulaceae bacterium]
MSDDINPYESPQEVESVGPLSYSSIDWSASLWWPVVFGANLIVPVLLGWQIAREYGRFGMCLTSFLFLAAGWALCCLRPAIARRLIAGSAVFAISQLFPLIQMVSGIVAVGAVEWLGLGDDRGDMGISTIPTFLGGCLATAIVGIILLSIAGVLGFIVSFLLPKRWFESSRTSWLQESHPPSPEPPA